MLRPSSACWVFCDSLVSPAIRLGAPGECGVLSGVFAFLCSVTTLNFCSTCWVSSSSFPFPFPAIFLGPADECCILGDFFSIRRFVTTLRFSSICWVLSASLLFPALLIEVLEECSVLDGLSAIFGSASPILPPLAFPCLGQAISLGRTQIPKILLWELDERIKSTPVLPHTSSITLRITGTRHKPKGCGVLVLSIA